MLVGKEKANQMEMRTFSVVVVVEGGPKSEKCNNEVR
jgi:hypothetical protein